MTALDGVNGTVCNAQQYQQSQQSYDSRSPSISCLTHGDTNGLAVSTYLMSPTLNSFDLQFASAASSLSCICVVIIFIWIGVRPAFIHVFILLDEMLHSGTYVGIRRRSQTVTGGCLRGLLTSIWSARQFLCCHLLRSWNFHHSSRFSHSTFCKQLVVSSMSGGLTTGSSRQGPIAQHKALSNRLAISESP